MCDSLSSYLISIMLYIENACALLKCSYCRLFDEQIKILLMYVLVQDLHKGEIKICIFVLAYLEAIYHKLIIRQIKDPYWATIKRVLKTK